MFHRLGFLAPDRHSVARKALLLAVGLLALDSQAPCQELAVGRQGMVSTAHPLATNAGLKVLESGGNAFDAAVAIAATLNVVEPQNSGLGGYGTILLWDARRGSARFLNCSGHIPVAVNADVFRPPTPDYLANRHGPKAISTPGNARAWEAMWRRSGTRPWPELFESAVQLAEEGFVLDQTAARIIARAFAEFSAEVQTTFGKNGQPLGAGDRLVQGDLGRSLRQVAEHGAEALHGGELGRRVAAAMKERGSFLALTDLRQVQAEWWQPIRIVVAGAEVLTASPPATAFPSLIRLGMMSRLDLRQLGHNSADYLHYFAEVSKHAFWCRLRHAGDPDLGPPPLRRLLSVAYWEEQLEKIDSERARPFVPPGPSGEPDSHTTHFVVADRHGNVVSATQTLGNSFGSRVVPAGTGIFLNNSLAYCTFEPPGNPMDAHAGHRKLSGDCPTLILRNGRPVAALGTPGGHTIGQTVPQMVLNLLAFDMDIAAALAAPRLSFVEPQRIVVDRGLPESVLEELRRRGHDIRTGTLGKAHGLTIEYDAEQRPIRFTGAADPRGGGLARGF